MVERHWLYSLVLLFVSRPKNLLSSEPPMLMKPRASDVRHILTLITKLSLIGGLAASDLPTLNHLRYASQ